MLGSLIAAGDASTSSHFDSSISEVKGEDYLFAPSKFFVSAAASSLITINTIPCIFSAARPGHSTSCI